MCLLPLISPKAIFHLLCFLSHRAASFLLCLVLGLRIQVRCQRETFISSANSWSYSGIACFFFTVHSVFFVCFFCWVFFLNCFEVPLLFKFVSKIVSKILLSLMIFLIFLPVCGPKNLSIVIILKNFLASFFLFKIF